MVQHSPLIMCLLFGRSWPFCRPKDPPTLQRFAASLAQLSLSKQGVSTTAQRHTAGIRARQQAQVVAAAREVAALADDVVGVGGHKQNG